MAECQKNSDWDKWKTTIEVELCPLYVREVFGPVVPSPPEVIPEECKWVFLPKRNRTRHKARQVAQGFPQRPDIDYNEIALQ
jgi:hypothetical protein